MSTAATFGASIDHVAVAGYDLAALARKYERLGFNLTPPSIHEGVGPSGAVEQWGTGNRCAMLDGSYIELLAIVDPTRFDNGLKEYLAKYSGLRVLALRCDELEAATATLASQGDATAVTPLARDVPLDDSRQVRVRFEITRIHKDRVPEGRVLFIRHLTPELLWHPTLLSHPNSATSIERIVLVARNIEEMAQRYRRFLHVEPAWRKGAAVFSLEQGEIELMTLESAVRTYRQGPIAPQPCIAGMDVGVLSLTTLKRVLDQGEVPYVQEGTTVFVAPEAAGGVHLRFRAADTREGTDGSS